MRFEGTAWLEDFRNSTRWVATVCAAVTPLVVVSGARADSQVNQAARVLQLNRDAMEMFSELELELAEESLNEALRLIEAGKLDRHAVAVKTLVNLGILHAVGHKDRDRAVAFFARALAIKPDAQLPPDYVTPESREAFGLAQQPPRGRRAGAPPTAAPAASPAPEETGVAGAGSAGRKKGGPPLRCPESGEVPDNDDVILRCVTAADFQPREVRLHYRTGSSEEYSSLPMQAQTTRSQRATWSATIPAARLQGKYLSVYFEARDEQGAVLAQSGRFESPSILSIQSSKPAATPAVAARRKIENPLDRRQRGDADERARAGDWLVGLGVGSGMGYAMGPGVEVYRAYTSSFTPGLAGYGLGQGLPELGYHVTDRVALTLQARVQYIPRPDTITAGGAVLGLARALFFSGTGRARFYGALALGGGEGFRLVVQARAQDGRTVQDTVRGGPLCAGLGGGFSYDFSSDEDGPVWSWMLESNLLAGLPDPSLALDVNTGVRVSF